MAQADPQFFMVAPRAILLWNITAKIPCHLRGPNFIKVSGFHSYIPFLQLVVQGAPTSPDKLSIPREV